MKRFLALILIVCPFVVYAGGADDAYQAARECYQQLQNNPQAQQYRESWEDCVGQFKKISVKYSRSERGADAKYSLGKLYEGLAVNSKNKADWNTAVKEYESFARQFPRNSMADDAFFRSAAIRFERLNDKSGAKKSLIKIVKFYKDGDQIGRAEKYLEDLSKGIVPNETAPKPYNGLRPGFSPLSGTRGVVIVLDPGHGGSDTGAVGPGGTQEKDLTLEIAKRLSSELKDKITGAVVYLTRESDRALILDERVAFANKKRADLFISIHANASESSKERGIQTYYLNNATDSAASRLAAQENKSSGRKTSDLDKIISTMIQNASAEESRELAGFVHKSLVKGLSHRYSMIKDEKVRSALFYVLVGVKCPSILVEVSYVSNPAEEKRLTSRKYQKDIADAISAGVSNHITASKKKGFASSI